MAFHKPETPKSWGEDNADFLLGGVGESCFVFLEGGNPIMALTGRMVKNTYLGVRQTEFRILFYGLYIIIIIIT